MDRDDSFESEPGRGWSSFVAPVLVLLVVIGIISALVLTGVVWGDEVREGPDQASTTIPTVEIIP